MPTIQSVRYRFGVFELDGATGELRRKGLRIRLHAQPLQILLLLLDRPGDLVSREEIVKALWPDGTFVDFDHGINSAIARLRDALGDTAAAPRYIETLARRGYRIIAPVEAISSSATPQPVSEDSSTVTSSGPDSETGDPATIPPPDVTTSLAVRLLAAPHELPRANRQTVQYLYLGMQLMYLAFYIGALANLPEINELLSYLPHATHAFAILIASAAALIPARAFTFTTALMHAPHARQNFLRLWPLLLVADELWALSPFLLLHHINFGVALACTALLIYSPFAQRSLVLMGAGQHEG